ncbi:P-loop containing nucleoside triphosphate hydrolase protein [Ephemerocybe angulata]|uniref:DNA 3'-5' helicase n=1 Tax=Ephemerocybe angulata TaxID=980116 RepID=A0A8H6I3V4_9AGAR|nr:P-loop containing nucleoside triphosphate hydrolase protein [Tulosesus angulatus]
MDQDSEAWLEETLCKAFKVQKLRLFQLQHALDLRNGRDVFLTIATGQGKTTVLLSPLVAAMGRSEKGIGIGIVPTKALAQQLEKTALAVGVRAVAVTEDTIREADASGVDLFKVLSMDGVRLAVMSPQMLRSERFNAWIRSARIREAIRWMLIDEAHLVLEESSTFKTPYANIALMRSRLPSSTVWCAVTGSVTPANAPVAATLLGFRPGLYVDARYRLDRPLIKYIPRILQHPTSNGQYLDLAPTIPRFLTSAQQITPTLIFAESIATSHAIMCFLDSLIPPSVPNRTQIIKLYNSLMPIEYRQNFIREITSGTTLRIGVVTDSLTYGLDIPNLPRVIVFDLCASPEIMKQKMGRCGRNGCPATAITYAPAWVEEIPVHEVQSQKAKDDARRRAALHPMLLKWFNPTLHQCPRLTDNQYYGDDFQPEDNCCVVCSPDPERDTDCAAIEEWKTELQARQPMESRAGSKLPRSDGSYRSLVQSERDELKKELLQWRCATWNSLRKSTAKDRHTPAEVFLPTHILQYLVNHAHICSTYPHFKLVMSGWRNVSDQGQALHSWLQLVLANAETGCVPLLLRKLALYLPLRLQHTTPDTKTSCA